MSRIGKEIYKSGNISLGPLSPNHPIYNTGFVIGERRLKPSSPTTQVENAFKGKHEDDEGES